MLQNVPTEISLTFLGKTIRPVLLAKDLGINLDPYLSYDDHRFVVYEKTMSNKSREG
jgi:hypothetical protein